MKRIKYEQDIYGVDRVMESGKFAFYLLVFQMFDVNLLICFINIHVVLVAWDMEILKPMSQM